MWNEFPVSFDKFWLKAQISTMHVIICLCNIFNCSWNNGKMKKKASTGQGGMIKMIFFRH